MVDRLLRLVDDVRPHTYHNCVSVIIPAYMCERFIEGAIESALEQPETGEVIVVEDGSIDDTWQRVNSIRSRKVRVLTHPCRSNVGAAASRNLGLLNATRPYIAFLDADDYYLNGRFKNAISILAALKSVAGVYEPVIATFEDGDAEKKWFRAHKEPTYGIKVPIAPCRLFESLVRGESGHFHTSGVTARRSAFARSGLFETALPLAQDTAMWLRLSATSLLVAGQLTKPVSARRIHSGNRCFVGPEEKKLMHLAVFGSTLHWARTAGLRQDRVETLARRFARVLTNPPEMQSAGGLMPMWAAVHHGLITLQGVRNEAADRDAVLR
jgi:glycosyltransferase involved in cell wall biosynthesis